jgi:Mrp family chromosome partitioning ATPase
MTALDQAFIKAFSQQGASPVVLPRESAAPACEPRPFHAAPKQESVAPKPEVTAVQQEVAAAKTEAVAPKTEVASSPISDVFRDVLATLEKPPALATKPAKAEVPPEVSPWRSEGDDITGAWAADCWQTPLDTSGSVGFAESVCIAEPIDLPEFTDAAESTDRTNPLDAAKPVNLADFVAAAVESPVASAVELPHHPLNMTADRPVAGFAAVAVELPCECNAVNVQPSTGNCPPSTFASPFASVSRKETPSRAGFKPAWQVDRFTWPRVCRRLMAKANDEFDRLADALMAANSRGQKVLAMAGCCRGEGATTLLLCAARRLAERGVKLILVDADLARPRIAKRLGVQPQVGWNETSEEEGTPLDHAIVQAASNGLTLSTVHDPASPTGHTTGDWSLLAQCLEKLKQHYEMVLVDLGPLENIKSIGDALNRTVAGKIDALLVVHNGRVTSAERLGQVEQELTASGVPLAGMIENFVAV